MSETGRMRRAALEAAAFVYYVDHARLLVPPAVFGDAAPRNTKDRIQGAALKAVAFALDVDHARLLVPPAVFGDAAPRISKDRMRLTALVCAGTRHLQGPFSFLELK